MSFILSKPESYGMCSGKPTKSVQNRHVQVNNTNPIFSHSSIKSILLISALLMFVLLFNKPVLAQASMNRDIHNGEWTLIQTVDQVKFYYQTSLCNGHSFLLLKVVNGNAATVHGSWQMDVQSNSQKRKCMGLLLPTTPGQSRVGSCEKPDPDMVIPFTNLNTATLQISLEAKIILH
jgi:hypothetical protein